MPHYGIVSAENEYEYELSLVTGRRGDNAHHLPKKWAGPGSVSG